MPGLRPVRPIAAPTGKTNPASPFLMVKLVCGYILAVVLPWLAASLSFYMSALSGMRLALNFSVIAAAVTFFGLGPALVATVVSAVAFNHYFSQLQSPGETFADTLIRTGVILLAGLLIAMLFRQRTFAERELRAALGDLQEQADALIQAQQASRSAAWSFNTLTRHTHWYQGGAEIFGRPHEEITALGSPTSLVLEDDRPRIASAAQLTELTGAPFAVEFRVLWPNGEVHWLEARGTPLPSNPALWRGATIDVTERKHAEAALIHSEKLAVAGRLAASIAHEINNPLEAVTNLCYLARLTSVDPETRGYIELAEAELSRVAHITSQTLRFHRQQTAAAGTDLAETVRSILSFYGHKLAQAGVEVNFEAQPVQPLLCYAGEIRQVLANLIANAIDAMPKGGALRLRLRPSTDWRTGASAVRVTVADTGHGMSAETRKRIYEPFYTTKGDLGSGLGLWVTAGIVEKHHGSLKVRSAQKPVGGGSVFSLLLPYASGMVPEK
jgi:PAS domain S-box-containing protein